MLVLTSGLFSAVCVILGVAYYSSKQITIPCRGCPQGDPGDLGLPFENVQFTTEDGLTLEGWYIPAKSSESSSQRVVIVCHGQMAIRWDCLDYVPFLREAGYGVLLFDFRAHGTSEGDICTIGFLERLDVKAAVQFMLHHSQPEWIGILGLSMGGSAAILAAVDLPAINAVVADCPFATFTDAIFDVCRKFRLPVLG
ncbi:MAG TPA: alpha/beta fold hydrolase [bacterium]|nr:alpha/beta fold hydrolase [bacterium]